VLPAGTEARRVSGKLDPARPRHAELRGQEIFFAGPLRFLPCRALLHHNLCTISRPIARPAVR